MCAQNLVWKLHEDYGPKTHILSVDKSQSVYVTVVIYFGASKSNLIQEW